ncbi:MULTISPECIES: cold-shock protein [Stutzerimonas stutzeri subgroup]|jgi:cold shock protein|uniref:Cold-shock protein n=1 Tax=Stutzerimonas stutzeri TaxID=316 RepID=A0A2N8R9Q7_STUST|nr:MULTISPECIES: cold-shock protein [Stutzerimonas stutzeri subgroup]KRW70942.1 cold-shock protein [Pseudomonas sp. TTU2014-105ASC]PNF57809.1 cold-shock protein [Stutzerimonas stutzeri]
MLKIVHVLAGIVALLLSFVPSLQGAVPLLLQPEALCLLMLGLLSVQFAPSAQLIDSRTRPVIIGASALLLVAIALQAIVLLAAVPQIAGQPATLASLLLAFIAVLLHLATPRSRSKQPKAARTNTTTTPPAAGREAGTVKWFNTSKGFGFISRDSGDDVFVHFRAIRGEGHRILVEGQRVEFTIMMRDKGLQAEDVVPTDGR